VVGGGGASNAKVPVGRWSPRPSSPVCQTDLHIEHDLSARYPLSWSPIPPPLHLFSVLLCISYPQGRDQQGGVPSTSLCDSPGRTSHSIKKHTTDAPTFTNKSSVKALTIPNVHVGRAIKNQPGLVWNLQLEVTPHGKKRMRFTLFLIAVSNILLTSAEAANCLCWHLRQCSKCNEARWGGGGRA